MIGQCKFCHGHDSCFWSRIWDEFGCVHFNPQETLLESEITEWMQFVKKQEAETAVAILKGKRKYIKHDDNCIKIEQENGDILIIPIDEDYLDFATDMLDVFIGDADYNDLAIGDKIIFTFTRMSNEDYKELCEESEDNEN